MSTEETKGEWPVMILPVTPSEIIAELQAFPANGKPPADDRRYLVWVHMETIGLIESRTQTSPCRACSKPRVDYSYHCITPAGRLILEMAEGK